MVDGKKNMLNTNMTNIMINASGNNRFINLDMYGQNLNSPVLLIVDIIDVVIKKPDTTKKTSTPPDTLPNQIW